MKALLAINGGGILALLTMSSALLARPGYEGLLRCIFVAIIVHSRSDTRQVVIRTAVQANCKVEVVVSDSGPGIPEQEIDEIFDTFYTTKKHGTGLGLSIARTIVETYGGKIWAENRAEGGAAFHFTIPLTYDMPGQWKASRQRSARAHVEV